MLLRLLQLVDFALNWLAIYMKLKTIYQFLIIYTYAGKGSSSIIGTPIS